MSGESNLLEVPELGDVRKLRRLFEPATHPQIDERLPDAVLLAPDRRLLIPSGFDKRLVGYHGGLDPREATIPLLVG